MINFLFVFFALAIFPQLSGATEWSTVFKKHETILADKYGTEIIAQYQAYVGKCAPTIVALEIKSIIIQENNEPLVDIKQMNHQRIFMEQDAPDGKSFAGPQYNAGLPNSSKIRLTIWHKLEQTLKNLDELAEYFGYTAGTIQIRVFEGLRDIATQKNLFDNKVHEIRTANPDMNLAEAEQEASKWVSPVKNNIPVHSTGAAVDIRLWNTATQDYVDMGKFGVIWGQNKNEPMFSEELSTEQKMNRLYLLLAATKAGLVGYIYEHWHFSFGDRYAAYWLQEEVSQRVACYGPINF